MPIRNPRFEEAGERAGDALHWSRRSFASGWIAALLGREPHRAHARFQPDIEWRADFDQTPSARARFSQVAGAEDFEGRWLNDTWRLDWPTLAERASFGTAQQEDFAEGWPVAGFATAFEQFAALPAGWGDAESVEAFTAGWPVASFVWTWSEATGQPAVFEEGLTVEVFAPDAWP
mgnify:CR=1 FL=1